MEFAIAVTGVPPDSCRANEVFVVLCKTSVRFLCAFGFVTPGCVLVYGACRADFLAPNRGIGVAGGAEYCVVTEYPRTGPTGCTGA